MKDNDKQVIESINTCEVYQVVNENGLTVNLIKED